MKDIIVDNNQKETIDNIAKEFNLHNVSTRTTADDKVFIAGTSKNKYLVRIAIEPLYMEESSSELYSLDDHKLNINDFKQKVIKECIRLYNQGYSQIDIADRLNISQSTVSNYLRKKEDNN